MAVEVILPRVDMDMTEGRISLWHVAEGDSVAAGQPIFEIETDKAAMEIEAPESGVIRGLRPAGERLPVGTPVAWILEPGEAFAPQAAAATPLPEAVASVPDPAAEEAPPAAAAGPGPRATPLARKLAREAGLALETLAGTGPRGRIQRADVETALGHLRTRAPAVAAVAAPAPAPVSAALVSAAPVSAGPVSAGLAIRPLRDGTGDPLLLLHGFGAETAAWRTILPALSLPNPVLGIDLPAHGGSAAAGAADFGALAGALEASLAAAGLVRLHLCGHSLGGAVSAALAGGGAIEARSLTLIAPAGLGPAINGAFLSGFLAAESEPVLAAWMRELVADPESLPPALVRATLRSRQGTRLAEAQAALAAALFPQGTQLVSIAAALGRIGCPSRLLHGLADRIIPPPPASVLPPALALHLLPGTGHLPQVERPDLVARLIAETVRSAG
jgi:pyruvate dehydrogenase E2 component (dihydrolipoamide acetyltransferase)